MAFEVFHPEQDIRLVRRRQPIVTLSKSAIKLNKMALDKLNAETVELAFDPATRVIRLKPAAKGFAIEKKKISSKGFFKYFGIDAQGKFPVRVDESDRSIYIDISQADKR
ncbi:hypothetical protein ACP3TJ_12155 [Desulforudis sp. 1088]|uniref:hypothetical protein n=1 Tax=unclassified Candidatus Desulforudis TaxID=2635950 RepID=UPI0034996180